MESQKVNKNDLLKILKDNRDKHKAIFDEALVGYKEQATKLLKEHLKRVQNGSKTRVYVSVPYPVNMTKEYNRIIGMLEMSLANEVELTEQDYQQYVMDDWTWKQSFLASNSAYSLSATQALGNGADEQ
jgi:hypothetical protein